MQFTINRDIDSDGSLRPLLEAHFKYERTSDAKSFYLHLLAIVGVLVWLAAIWPSLIPGELEEFVLIVWGALFFVAVWASVEAWTCRRRMIWYLSRASGKATASPVNRLPLP